MSIHSVFIGLGVNSAKIPTLPKSVYQFNAIPFKIPADSRDLVVQNSDHNREMKIQAGFLVQIDSIILRYTVGLPYLWIYYTWF
jgi:hypothetical protein